MLVEVTFDDFWDPVQLYTHCNTQCTWILHELSYRKVLREIPLKRVFTDCVVTKHRLKKFVAVKLLPFVLDHGHWTKHWLRVSLPESAKPYIAPLLWQWELQPLFLGNYRKFSADWCRVILAHTVTLFMHVEFPMIYQNSVVSILCFSTSRHLFICMIHRGKLLLNDAVWKGSFVSIPPPFFFCPRCQLQLMWLQWSKLCLRCCSTQNPESQRTQTNSSCMCAS